MFHFRWYCVFVVPSCPGSTKRNVYTLQVIPFGDPRLIAVLRLTGAYRSLSRPSSPAGTKAFTICPLLIYLCPLKLVRPLLSKRDLCLSLFPYAVVNELRSLPALPLTATSIFSPDGGPDWTRTSDPRLIKAVL